MQDSEVFDDTIFGFHARQTVENSMKAWLSSAGVAYSKIHDLEELFTLLEIGFVRRLCICYIDGDRGMNRRCTVQYSQGERMRRQEILDRLSAHRAEVKEMGIESLALFGSAVRDEATPASDIDLLVTFNQPIGLLGYARIRRRLSDILGSQVDLVTNAALRKEMREEILQEAVRAA